MSKMKNLNIKKYAELAVKGSEPGPADTFTKVLKVLYWLAAAAAIMTCLTMIIGNILLMAEYKGGANATEVAKFNENKTQLITMLTAVFSLVASYFLLHFKQAIPFVITASVDCVIIFSTLYSVSVKNDVVNGGMQSFWTLAIPSIICVVLALVLGSMIFVTYQFKIPAAYDKLIYELYQSNSKNGKNPISPEEFEKICDAYRGEEIFRTDIPLKKSVKRRKEKQEEKEK